MKTNSDTTHYLASSASRSKFVLSRRKHERGQVAIFVALIFQVVFVFFALLINVGLLVHHKINLQHSTDLAAYYGAMKQAEQMNAIAHINFQMRQAWKLLTWRYRVFGTFGFIQGGGVSQQFPFNQRVPSGSGFTFNGSLGQAPTNLSNAYRNGPNSGPNVTNCANLGNPSLQLTGGGFMGIQDIPFFCVGHEGIYNWTKGESLCRLSCDMFLGANVINAIPTVNSASTLTNPNLSGAINTTIGSANATIQTACQNLGPVGAKLLTKFLIAYQAEETYRSETIKMLAANLSEDVGRTVDLDGSLIIDGSRRTFQNNLTGANFTGLDQSASFRAYNGLSNQRCKFVNGNTGGSYEFLKKIEFKLVNYFLHTCEVTGGSAPASFDYEPKSLFKPGAPNSIETSLTTTTGAVSLNQEEIDFLSSLLNPQNLHTIGYEKNPNCVEYFAVRTYSEPTIPFLPLSKIRLEAAAVAKPFGGSIGPSFGKTWSIGDERSVYADSVPDSRIDPALPRRDFDPNDAADIKKSVEYQPNFGLYVGDHLGLRSLDYLATYHSMLANRDIKNYTGKSYESVVNIQNKISSPSPNNPNNPNVWPAFDNWKDISSIQTDARGFDSLASDASAQAGMRAIEITAIVPNQFDVTYYSIDPDFFNNYYIKIYKNFTAIRNAAGNNVNLTANQVRADFGAYGMDGTTTPVNDPPLTTKSFSVKDQIYLKNIVLRDRPKQAPTVTIPSTTGPNYTDFLNFLVNYQTSLLTGWTFLRFNDYNTFPGQPVDKSANTMTFGQCDDPWNKTTSSPNPTADSNFHSPMNSNADNPPVPGNCVTGGRTGYSVKLVSPAVVLDQGEMLNPMPLNFFDF
jgi:hypothetical protein